MNERVRNATAPRTPPARPRTSMDARLAPFRLVSAGLVLLPLLLLPAGCARKLPPAPESPTAAVVGKRTITMKEVDEAIRQSLFERRFPAGENARLFEARQNTLDDLIDAEVVEQAAKGSGMTPGDWLAAEVAARMPVTDEEVDAFIAEHEHRIPKDRAMEEVRVDVREYLIEDHTQALIDELRREARVRMVLARPRSEVEPRGVARGPAHAPVTIVEFSDFECPYCKRATPILQELLDRYPEQVRLYYRHLPLPSHAHARPAAIAAVCAERQGQFWDFHDQLFLDPGALDPEGLRRAAEQVGIDLEPFDECLGSAEAAARVDEDVAAANALGVTGTPVFFVNGIRVKGAQPLSRFVRLVEEEIALREEE